MVVVAFIITQSFHQECNYKTVEFRTLLRRVLLIFGRLNYMIIPTNRFSFLCRTTSGYGGWSTRSTWRSQRRKPWLTCSRYSTDASLHLNLTIVEHNHTNDCPKVPVTLSIDNIAYSQSLAELNMINSKIWSPCNCILETNIAHRGCLWLPWRRFNSSSDDDPQLSD